MKKVLPIVLVLWAGFFMAALTVASAAKASTVSGYVSDSVCLTKAASGGYADCTNKCLVKGAQLVIVVDVTQQILTIDNPDVVKGHECHHVLLTGDINIHTSVIHIYSVRTL
jgi:hypothetical protein